MLMKGIINGKIILEDRILEDRVLIITDKVERIIDINELNTCKDIEIIDAGGCYVSPGFIDIHIHGAGGYDTMDGSIDALKEISRTIVRKGTTAFLPTTMTMDKVNIFKALNSVKNSMKEDLPGAKILGVHLEGPFINEKYKGAQNSQYIIKPDYEFIREYIEIIRIITLAPETDENFQFIDKIKRHHNVVLSIGHSNATYEQSLQGINRGITHSTHTFNAMTPLHHRKPGIVGAALTTDITCEVIVDNIHVHPCVYKLLIDVKGIDSVVLVTDSMRAGCMDEGIYELGGQRVFVQGEAARLEDGTLAGSILSLNKAIKNVIEGTGIKIYEAVRMATLNPARVIGVDSKKGSIEAGKDADLVIFNDNFDVKHAIIGGKTVYLDT